MAAEGLVLTDEMLGPGQGRSWGHGVGEGVGGEQEETTTGFSWELPLRQPSADPKLEGGPLS